MAVAVAGPAPGEPLVAHVKGAAEVVLRLCTARASGYANVVLTTAKMAGRGLRVLALARREIAASAPLGAALAACPAGGEPPDRAAVEDDLTFLALVGIYDPPRPETAESVGIVPAGLDPAEARRAGLVMTAPEDGMPQLPLVLARCSPESKVKLVHALKRRKAFVAMTGDGVRAEIAQIHPLRAALIINVQVDGPRGQVNDAPSIVQADVGIAMGLSGSDVTKEAADIVLTDDNFASIVHAVEDGRRIFANIGKFLVHLLSSNVAEARPPASTSPVIVLVVGLVFGTFPKQDDPSTCPAPAPPSPPAPAPAPSRSIAISSAEGAHREGYVFPMTAIQVLYLNLVTGTPADIALGAEAASPDLMLMRAAGPSRPIRSRLSWFNAALNSIFRAQAAPLISDTFVYGIVMGAFSLASFCVVIFWRYDGDYGVECGSFADGEGCGHVPRARSAAFGLLVLAFLIRHRRLSVTRLAWRPAKPLFIAVLVPAALTAALFYIPVINDEASRFRAPALDGIRCGRACKRRLLGSPPRPEQILADRPQPPGILVNPDREGYGANENARFSGTRAKPLSADQENAPQRLVPTSGGGQAMDAAAETPFQGGGGRAEPKGNLDALRRPEAYQGNPDYIPG
eukprot:tig00021254_g19695.t1